MKVAHISTYKVSCGVGIYLEELTNELSKLCENKIFAEKIVSPQIENESLNKNINVEYERCWTRYQGYEELQQKIIDDMSNSG